MARSRKGTGDLPPNPKQWAAESHGLDLREELAVAVEAPLSHVDAFALMPDVSIAAHGEVPAAASVIRYFRERGKSRWSGLALPIEDGRVLVLYNDAHPITRIRATLMEEFFHLRLGHHPSALRLLDGAHRTHNKFVESEAYSSGAAALVPYRSLKAMYSAGTGVARMAAHFQVSPDLLNFRLKVTRLFRSRR